jgi:hypothetical protein
MFVVQHGRAPLNPIGQQIVVVALRYFVAILQLSARRTVNTEERNTFLTNINPDNSIKAIVLIDVPKG